MYCTEIANGRSPASRVPPLAVQAAPSIEPDRDKPGTLYMNWLFKPGAPDELVEDIYMHTLTLAIFAAIRRTPRARVIWPKDDEIADPTGTAPGSGRTCTCGTPTSSSTATGRSRTPARWTGR